MKATRTLCPAGFSLLEIMVVMAIIGLLAAIAIPNVMSARASVQSKTGIDNLSTIDDVAVQFALEHNKTAGDAVNFPGGFTPGIRLDPAGGLYTASAMGDLPAGSCNSLTPAPRLLP